MSDEQAEVELELAHDDMESLIAELRNLGLSAEADKLEDAFLTNDTDTSVAEMEVWKPVDSTESTESTESTDADDTETASLRERIEWYEKRRWTDAADNLRQQLDNQ